MDPLTLLLGAAGGVTAGVAGTYFWGRRRPTSRPRAIAPGMPLSPAKSVEKLELERRRRDTKSLLVEKEMLSAALARVFEAEADGRITKAERDLIVRKYQEQLRSVDERLGDVELYVEVGELEQLREELVGLFESKIQQIEGRLMDARSRLQRIAPPVGGPVTLKEEKPAEKKEERKRPKPESTEVDERVKELKNEVLEALARLEQMDIEG